MADKKIRKFSKTNRRRLLVVFLFVLICFVLFLVCRSGLAELRGWNVKQRKKRPVLFWLLYTVIFLLMFLLQKTITYYQQTDQAAQGIISVEEPDTSKMFWKIVLAQRVTEEIKEKAGLQEDNVYEN